MGRSCRERRISSPVACDEFLADFLRTGYVYLSVSTVKLQTKEMQSPPPSAPRRLLVVQSERATHRFSFKIECWKACHASTSMHRMHIAAFCTQAVRCRTQTTKKVLHDLLHDDIYRYEHYSKKQQISFSMVCRQVSALYCMYVYNTRWLL